MALRQIVKEGDSVLECEESQYTDHFSKKDHDEYTQKDKNWKKVIPVSLEQYTYGGNYEQKILNDSTVVPLEERILEQLGLEHDLVKLKKVMKKLKPYEREIIYQLFWMNKSQNDLAMKYSVTRQTMHEKVHRILVKVLKLFENEKFDIVINFAAESHVDNSILNPQIFTITNILGTQVLLDACRKYNIKRFHQVSTDEVYGELPLDDNSILFTEKTPLNPSSPYSASKASADMLVKSYYRTYSLPITISRCSNNYGPYQHLEKLIPLMISKAINNDNLPVYGNGLNVRDWLHVYDHCTAIDLIIHEGKIGEIYNIGGNNEKSNIDVVKIILKELGKSEKLIKYVNDRPGHDLRYAIDSTKIKTTLNWKPVYSFEKGILDTIKWYTKML